MPSGRLLVVLLFGEHQRHVQPAVQRIINPHDLNIVFPIETLRAHLFVVCRDHEFEAEHVASYQQSPLELGGLLDPLEGWGQAGAGQWGCQAGASGG